MTAENISRSVTEDGGVKILKLPTIEITVKEYVRIIRENERIAIITRLINENGYVGTTELKKILNIEQGENR